MGIENVRLVVLDQDGTIIDNFGLYKDIRIRVHKEFKLPPDVDFQGKPAVDFYRSIGLQRESITKLLDRFCAIEYQCHSRLFSDVEPFLRLLTRRGIRVGIVTNRFFNRWQYKFLKKVGAPLHLLNFYINYDPFLEDDFKRVRMWNNGVQYFISKYCKPDLRMLDAIRGIIDAKRILPSEILVIGDTEVDMRLAINGGFQFIGVSGGYEGNEQFLRAGVTTAKDIAAIHQIFRLAYGADEH